MPRGVYPRSNVVSISSLPQTVIEEAGKLTSNLSFSFLNQLKAKEQQTLLTESKLLTAAIINFETSRLAIGEHLTNIQKVLIPYNGLWTQFLKEFQYKFSPKTAYRWMEGFKNASTFFKTSPMIVRVAMSRGMDIAGHTDEKPLGIYTEAVKTLPPPSNPSAEEAGKYLDKVEEVRKGQLKAARDGGETETVTLIKKDPRFVTMQCYRFVRNAIKTLSKAEQLKVVHSVHGMILTEIEHPKSVSVKPEEIPEDFKQGRGRPRELPAVA